MQICALLSPGFSARFSKWFARVFLFWRVILTSVTLPPLYIFVESFHRHLCFVAKSNCSLWSTAQPVIGLMPLLFLELSLSISERYVQDISISFYLVDMGHLALEFVTGGLARATSHHVLSPKGTTPRYSVPFFQNIGLDVRLTDHMLKCKYLYHFLTKLLFLILLQSRPRLRNYKQDEDSFRRLLHRVPIAATTSYDII